MFSVVLFRIAQLSLTGNDHEHSEREETVRGSIEDRRSLALAVTEEAATIAIAPQEITDYEFIAEHLGTLLGVPSNAILNQLYEYRERKYFYLKRQVDNFTADRIMELHLPGVYRESEYRRYYPGESLASNLIGFVGRDMEPLAGLEYVYDDILALPEKTTSRKGPTIRLTLDSLIQYRLEEAMEKSFTASGSKRATAILMDIQTGEILALANYPNFNPNEYYKSTPMQRGNWAIRLNYEPGSTVKIFMAASLLMENAVTPAERFACNGEFIAGNVLIRDRAGDRPVSYGMLTLEEVLIHSSNVGIIRASRRIRKDRLYHYMSRLGFGKKTGVLPPGSGETWGYFPELKEWVPSTGYYMPIGQGFSVTPLQLLRAAASVANGGTLVTPYIMKSIASSRGEVLQSFSSPTQPSPFSPEVNRHVLKMMRKVVTDGTGKRANLKEIQIAGKTGTAQKSTARGYGDQIVASFLGFFPAEKPRYGGLIVFDEPAIETSGGSLAAPVFGEFVKSILPLIQEGYRAEKVKKLKPMHTVRPRVRRDRLYDFGGLSAREALKILADYYHFPVRIKGSGYVYRQSPAPDTPVDQVKELELYLDDGELK